MQLLQRTLPQWQGEHRQVNTGAGRARAHILLPLMHSIDLIRVCMRALQFDQMKKGNMPGLSPTHSCL